LAVIILGFVIFQQARNTRQLGTVNDSLMVQIDLKAAELKLIAAKYAEYGRINDSLKAENFIKSETLNMNLKQIETLKRENKKLRDSLLAVPDDSIYSTMQNIQPATSPLIYRFDGPQVRFWYGSYLDNGFNLGLLKTSQNALNSCLDLNGGYVQQIANLEQKDLQCKEMNKNLTDQVVLYTQANNNLNTQLRKVKTNRYLWGGAGLLIGLLISR